ncbi:MAG: segregation/condensation protein A [Legionellales bacterium]|nr:segregation/condensation protein A [Legionellales bacterium]
MGAILHGKEISDIPENLYIPPKALRVILEAFEGPLDLLWYLIKKQNIDVLDIPIATIAAQYAAYIDLMHDLELDYIADYLVIAAMLAQIKSKMLLPKSELEDEEEEDPRAELVRKLKEYEQFKQIAEKLDELPRQERDIFGASLKIHDLNLSVKEANVSLDDLIKSFERILKRSKVKSSHSIKSEPISIREKMVFILDSVPKENFCDFTDLFNVKEGKIGVVVTFIALLELIKQNLLQLIQSGPFQSIHVKKM